MRIIIFIIVTICTLTSHAMSWPVFPRCSKKDVSAENQKASLEFLKSIEGYYENSKCSFQIQLLDETETAGLLKAEVLIQDSEMNELYIPLVFLKKRKTKKMYFCIQNNERMFHYEFADRNRNSSKAYKQKYFFEAVKYPDRDELQYIEAGIQTTRDNKLRWIRCDI